MAFARHWLGDLQIWAVTACGPSPEPTRAGSLRRRAWRPHRRTDHAARLQQCGCRLANSIDRTHLDLARGGAVRPGTSRPVRFELSGRSRAWVPTPAVAPTRAGLRRELWSPRLICGKGWRVFMARRALLEIEATAAVTGVVASLAPQGRPPAIAGARVSWHGARSGLRRSVLNRAPHTRHSTMTWPAMSELGPRALLVLAGVALHSPRRFRRIVVRPGQRRASAAGIAAQGDDAMVGAGALFGARPEARGWA